MKFNIDGFLNRLERLLHKSIQNMSPDFLLFFCVVLS